MTLLTRPKTSNSLMSGSLPITANNALFVVDAIGVPSVEAKGPAARTAGALPRSGTSQTTRFFAPAASSSESMVLTSATNPVTVVG
jgi:hypothetical protein